MKKSCLRRCSAAFLGIFDGLTALFTPEVRSEMVGIVIGSTVKGLLTGVIIGFFATKVRSLVLGLLFGLRGRRVLRLPDSADEPRQHFARTSCCRAAWSASSSATPRRIISTSHLLVRRLENAQFPCSFSRAPTGSNGRSSRCRRRRQHLHERQRAAEVEQAVGAAERERNHRPGEHDRLARGRVQRRGER